MAARTVFLCIHILYFVFVCQPKVESAQVTTQNGIVEGVQLTTAEENKTYYAFMGIPYAKPPIGNLRFQPPEPANNWTGVWNATYERSICVQTANSTVVVGSENCLFINVFTTQIPTTEKHSLKPVMFWIYGGGFLYGSGNIESQGPDYLLNENVIVVTLNYRVGVFGFLSTQDMVVPGNNGLKDQILGLHWVKNNIAHFGGDPNKVTIFGQSAGSASVSYLVQSKLTTGLYYAAIMQSGTALCHWALSRSAREYAFEVGRRLFIFTNDSNTLVQNLRNVDYIRLQSNSATAIDQVLQGALIEDFTLSPGREPEHPGAVFTSKSYELLEKGDFNRVPILIGFTSEEGNLFAPAFNLARPLLAIFDINQGMLVPKDMNIANTGTLLYVGHLIHNHYVGRLGTIALSPTGFTHYFSDTMFVRPIRQYVKLIKSYVSTYYYELSYTGLLGNPNRGNTKGVGHAEDLSYIFRIGSQSDNADLNDKTTRKRMVRMWTNFAKYRNPTPVTDSVLQNVSWSLVSASANLTYLDIDNNLEMRTNPHSYDMSFWDKLYNTYGIPPYDTY